MAGFFSLNGNGEMTGTHLVEETGFLEGPITHTNTVSVGDVRSWVIKYARAHPGTKFSPDDFGLIVPVVAETYDSYLNDIRSFDVIPNDSMYPLFEATVQATEEEIVNALCAASTVTGYQGNVAYAIKDAPPAATPPTLSLKEMLMKYNRYLAP
jgi:L-aminopeptidase/D-esterase-like protein